MIGFKAFTLLRCAQLQMKIRTHERSPSKVETLVISHYAVSRNGKGAYSRRAKRRLRREDVSMARGRR